MPVPAVAAVAVKPVVEKTIDRLNHPVIGIKRTVVKRTARKETTTTYSLELRGWELVLGGVAGVVMYELMQGSFNGLGGGNGGLNVIPRNPQQAAGYFMLGPLGAMLQGGLGDFVKKNKDAVNNLPWGIGNVIGAYAGVIP